MTSAITANAPTLSTGKLPEGLYIFEQPFLRVSIPPTPHEY